MAPCGRVRAGSRGPGPFLILLLLTLGPARAEQGAGAVAGFPGAPLQPQQAAVLGAQQPPQPVLAGAAPGGGIGRPPRAGASSGGGWKLADEPACREDVTRVCPKHSWANNLAVLECLQDVREVSEAAEEKGKGGAQRSNFFEIPRGGGGGGAVAGLRLPANSVPPSLPVSIPPPRSAT